MRWEYLTVGVSLSSDPLALNAYGSNRWELIAVCDGGSDGLHRAVFKRPLESGHEDHRPHHNAVLVLPVGV